MWETIFEQTLSAMTLLWWKRWKELL